MEKSGAGLTWDFFNPGRQRPYMIERIEDRDLWRFRYVDTRTLHACISSYPSDDFELFDSLVQRANSENRRPFLLGEGNAIDRRHMQMVKDTIKLSKRSMVIDGHKVPVCNAPYALSSDIGNILAKDRPFAATYVDTCRGRSFSLRSTEQGLDVSAIAKKYGGGGHRNAAGFTQASNWEGDPK
jgi:oligoribonuclease NrnB/cAMP/cGMP phosphodiesterase (DHH superfamily)